MVARVLGLILLMLVNGCTVEPPPEWTLGKPSPQGYLSAVGVGASLEEAQKQALLALREKCSWVPDGDGSLRKAMRIAETWHDRKRKNYQALAIIDRRSAVKPLLEALAKLEVEIAGQVAAAERTDSTLRRWGHYVKAISLAGTRAELAADVSRHDSAAVIPAGAHPWNTLVERRDQAASTLGLDAGAFNDPEDLVKSQLVRALAAQGLRLTPDFAAGLRIAGVANAGDSRVTARIEVLGAGGERVTLLQVEESVEGQFSGERLVGLLIDGLTVK